MAREEGAWSTWTDRQQRAMGHALLALFSLGYLGVAARTCATDVCGSRLSFLVATGAASTVLALILCGTLAADLKVAAVFEWTFALFLLIWWSVALALTMSLVENLFTPLAPPLVAFAWVAEVITLFLTATAFFGSDGPLSSCPPPQRRSCHTCPPGHSGTRPSMRNSGPVGSGAINDEDRERDYVPEDRYMDPSPTGDINYDSSNRVSNPLPHPDSAV